MEKPTRIELVAVFSADRPAGIRGGLEFINVSFAYQEIDQSDTEELCRFFREYLDADNVVTKTDYDRESKRLDSLWRKAEEEAGL